MRIQSLFSRAGVSFALLAATFVGLAPAAHAQKLVFRATLDGAQETPPSGSAATGTATIVVDRDKNTFNYVINYSGLGSAESAAHIHGFSAPGFPSGILNALPLGTQKIGTWTYSEAQEANIVAGLTYLNIHSALFPGGEIRGQVLLDTAPTNGLYASIDSAQEVPPTGTAGTGNAYFEIDTVAKTLTYNITFAGLSAAEVSAHIHGPAPVGVNGGIQLVLPAGSPKTGVWNYPPAQEPNILAGLMYVNIHSSAFPGGELRGQIIPAQISSTYCKGKINSKGCTPSIGSTGTPSASAGPDTYTVTCVNTLNNKTGILFWGTVPNNAAFLGGTLCVKPPIIRTAVQGSGGNPPPNDCTGTYSYLFAQAYMASHGLAAGNVVYCEWWSRDLFHPDGSGVGFSNALQFIIQP
ncbi:MAG: CHRD domain-containing protein [Planctomycetes bacterium]|nr:CHRD domain-containing protein [Planctomycetota bacterium]